MDNREIIIWNELRNSEHRPIPSHTSAESASHSPMEMKVEKLSAKRQELACDGGDGDG